MEFRDVVNDPEISGKLQHVYKFIHENNIDFNYTMTQIYDELKTKYKEIELNDSDGKKYITINLQEDETQFELDGVVYGHNEWSKAIMNYTYIDDNTIIIKPVNL